MNLKIVGYKSSSGMLPLNKIAYRVYGKQIVFSGLHSVKEGPRGSTFNCAEQIVVAIAQAEAINPREFQFFDLQTCKGYSNHKPGEFTFNMLVLEWNEETNFPLSVSWREGHPAPEILEDFANCVWSDKPRSIAVNLAVKYGSLKALANEPLALHP